MNRFVSEQAFEVSLDQLFGTSDWRPAKELAGDERRNFLYALYRRQLKGAGAKQVVHFHLFAGNRLKYSIFFGTRHTKGSDRMKKAIWRVAPFGDFSFRGGQQDQMVLFGDTPDIEPLRQALQDRFSDAGWVSIGDVLEFVKSDKTIYHDTQVKTPALKPMERQELLRVDGTTRSRRYTYPNGCRIKFAPQDSELQV